MHDQPKNPRSLSDISHLFLSSVRERQTGTSSRPQRTPPPKSDARDARESRESREADLTPQEFQHVLNESNEQPSELASVPPVRAVIASHLGSRQFDAVVACYRTLKGLADLHRPRLSIAALDTTDPAESEQVFSKMASTCMQFLNWPLEAEPPVEDAPHVAECTVMHCSVQGDKAHLATAGHWQVVAELLQATHESDEDDAEPLTPEKVINPNEMFSGEAAHKPRQPTADELAAQARIRRLVSVPKIEPMPALPPSAPKSPNASEVIELPDDEGSLIDAVMRHSAGEIIECPIRPPMCPQARLALTRDRRLTLIAAAGHGLAELRDIGQAVAGGGDE